MKVYFTFGEENKNLNTLFSDILKNFKTQIRRGAIIQGLGRVGWMRYSWICFQFLSEELIKMF